MIFIGPTKAPVITTELVYHVGQLAQQAATNPNDSFSLFSLFSPSTGHVAIVNDINTCFKLKLVSAYCLALFISSFLFNLLLLICLLAHKDLRSAPQNSFTIALCLLNFIGTIMELPPVIASTYSCHWIFSPIICYIGGFVMYWIGCTSIYLLMCMSLERFYIIYQPMSLRKLNRSVYVSGIVISLLIGLFWAAVPLLGWSYYSFEGAGTSCSVEWNERSPAVISYNVTILFLVFLVPLVVLFVTNIKLVGLVS